MLHMNDDTEFDCSTAHRMWMRCAIYCSHARLWLICSAGEFAGLTDLVKPTKSDTWAMISSSLVLSARASGC